MVDADNQENKPPESQDYPEQKKKNTPDLSSQLNQMLMVADKRSWLVLWILSAIILGAVLWAFLGSIPERVGGNGILVSEAGLFSAQAKVTGTIFLLDKKPGDIIKKGELIANVVSSEEELKKKSAQIRLNNLEKNYEDLEKEISTEEAARLEALQRQANAQQFKIKQLEMNVKVLNEDLQRKEELFKDGLVSRVSVLDSSNAVMQKNIELELSKGVLADIKSNMVKGYRAEELKTKKQQVLGVQEELSLSEQRLKNGLVTSPATGRLLQFLVNSGDGIEFRSPVAWLENYREGQETGQVVYGYFPVDKSKKILPGQTVLMEFTSFEAQEYGYMLGEIAEISTFALSEDMVDRTIQNKGLAIYLMGDYKAVVQAKIRPKLDPNSPTGYQWVEGKGPPGKMTTGSICRIRAIVDTVKPIYYVLRLLRYQQTE